MFCCFPLPNNPHEDALLDDVVDYQTIPTKMRSLMTLGPCFSSLTSLSSNSSELREPERELKFLEPGLEVNFWSLIFLEFIFRSFFTEYFAGENDNRRIRVFSQRMCFEYLRVWSICFLKSIWSI
jgi:hypothetical protein